ncbi:MAG: UDP-N-acetylmuramate--alanine ligase [Spirochaetaceae bacterium]|nr:UDP-N-acetylmuramate--alanine ligase [Spirochaetaceae bacterium]|tara:strand:- start:8665 stop:10140 length:1476 start_codon:yes stop_codon:yes gene_type:complete
MKVHLIGVGGAAMGNLAAMLKKTGHKVSGSDQDLYPPMSDRLREWKIDANPFRAASVKNKDLVIVGNAISRGNVELEEALRLGLPITSMASALQQFFLKGRKVIVVAGTHGKTTTSFLTDYLLSQSASSPGAARVAKKSTRSSDLPGLFVGGVRADGHPGFRIPGKNNPYFVIEGDEYDTAFFDKASKFLHYRPHHLILTSVEYDHADIFHDLDHYKQAFRILLRWIPPNGSLIPCLKDAGVSDVCKNYGFSDLLGYGKASVSHASRRGREVQFILKKSNGKDDLKFSCRPALIGSHNTLNAVAASLVARRCGLSQNQIINGLESFPGVLRRQQIRARSADESVVFMEDFAHHPTAVKETLQAVRQSYPGYRVIALYEPRSATSHRNVFATEYVDSLQSADLVLLPDVFNRKKVSSDQRLDVKKIVVELNRKGKSAKFCKDPAGVFQALKQDLNSQGRVSKSGSVKTMILAMSNGGFGGIYPQIDELVSRG